MANIEHPRGLEAALIVAEHLPREEDGTATIMEVAQRRDVLLGYLREAQADYRGAVEALTVARSAIRRRMASDESLDLPYDEDFSDAIRRLDAALGGQ